MKDLFDWVYQVLASPSNAFEQDFLLHPRLPLPTVASNGLYSPKEWISTWHWITVNQHAVTTRSASIQRTGDRT
jgi:hypothetical protein